MPRHDAATDQGFLAQAVALALENVGRGREPFGAVVVVDGVVVGTGVNAVEPDTDPVAHAEVAAVRAASQALGTPYLPGATVYSSCEPCVMCQAVCAVTDIRRVLYAAPREWVPPLAGPSRPWLPAMQDAVRPLAPGELRYVETPGAREPFIRFSAPTM